MKINTESIEKCLLALKNDILDICTNDNLNLSYFESKIDSISNLSSTLDTIIPFIDDEPFIIEFTALNIVSEKILYNQFEFFENESFRNSQINFLHNMGIDLNSNETINLDTMVDEEITTNNLIENKDNKDNQINYSKDNKKEKIKKESEKLIDKANESIKSYFREPHLMKEYLKYMSKFYNYSERNSLLIDDQFKGATAVGSFKFWSNQGYKINKGEKGIKILVPVDITYFKDKNGDEKQLKYATKEEKKMIKNKEIETYTRKYFNVGYVFDISQTNAPLEDLPKIFPNRWLNGDVANYDKMYNALEVVADKIGVKIIEPKSELGYIKGVSYTETKEVALNPRNGELQNIKTLIHELAHAKLHTIEKRNNYSKSEREYQAEMVAYATCSYFGLDTSDYSLDYLNNWTKNIDLEDCKKIIKEVKETTAEYIEIIENELLKDNSISLDKSNNIKEININNNSNNKDYDLIDNSKYNPKSKKLLLDNIYVKFISSDSKELNSGDKYDFRTANEIISVLSEKYESLGDPKDTRFELYTDKTYLNRFYSDSINVGDGLSYDLQNYLFRAFKNTSLKIDNNTRDMLINTFKPNFENKKEKDIYVKFVWSEHDKIKDNSIFKYKDADKLLENLTYICKSDKKHKGYYKTKFEIYNNKDCKGESFYNGRFDIGDGYAKNLSNHIDKFINIELDNIDMNTKNSLLKMLGINSSYLEKQIDTSLCL